MKVDQNLNVERQGRPYQYKYSLVATARWEEKDIGEWVEYHKSIGFDHIYIYSNDDDLLPTFQALAPYLYGAAPFVTLRHYPKRGQVKPQQAEIYFHFMRHFKDETEWFSLLDVDEFFVFKGLNNVKDFMAPFEEKYDAVYFNWLIYGHGDKYERDARSILLSHCGRRSAIDPHTKMISRSSKISEAQIRRDFEQGKFGFWHFWNEYDIRDLRITNVLQDDIAEYTSEFPNWALKYVERPGVSEKIINKAYVAHYQFKSELDFIRRVERGGSFTTEFWKKEYEEGKYRARLIANSEIWDTYLAKYWIQHLGKALEFVTEAITDTPRLSNIALWRPTKQSSVAEHSPCMVAKNSVQGGANDGVRTGGFGFATAVEATPWWMVDLLTDSLIAEIHLYHRIDWRDIPNLSRSIVISTSQDGQNWIPILTLNDVSAIGDITSAPFVVRPGGEIKARYVRISSLDEGTLQLDEVEIYGQYVTAEGA